MQSDVAAPPRTGITAIGMLTNTCMEGYGYQRVLLMSTQHNSEVFLDKLLTLQPYPYMCTYCSRTCCHTLTCARVLSTYLLPNIHWSWCC